MRRCGMPLVYDAMAGDRVEDSAHEMIAMIMNPNHSRSYVVCDFNGKLMYASRQSTAEEVVDRWSRAPWPMTTQSQRKAKAEHARKLAASRLEGARLVDEVMDRQLSTEEWLEFLNRCVEPLGWVGMDLHRGRLAGKLLRDGYERNAFTGKEYDPEDAYKCARYLIGQALDGLMSNYGIHGIYEAFYQRWKEKFRGVSA